MTRNSEICGRTTACLAAIACAFGLAAAQAVHADDVAPDPQAAADRPVAGSPATIGARRPGGAVPRRPRLNVTGVVRPAPAAARSPGRAGLVVEVDPLPGESKAVEGADQPLPPVRETDLTRSTDGLVLQVLPDGSRRVNLQGRFRAYSAVAIGADGALRMACADDQAAALALAAAAAHTPAARAHRVAFGPGEE